MTTKTSPKKAQALKKAKAPVAKKEHPALFERLVALLAALSPVAVAIIYTRKR